MKILKQIGRILFCLLPALLALAIQFLVVLAGFVLKIVSLISKDPSLINGIASPDFIYGLLGDSQFLMLLSAIYGIISALVLGFWYWKRFVPKKKPRRAISDILNPGMFLGLVFLMVGMQYISTYLIAIVAAINPSWLDTYESLMENAGFGNITLVLALYSVLVAPISEELIFRGVTLRYAAKAMPFFLANIFQAFLFGLFHGNVVQGTYAFVVGLFCGYVYMKGGSIYLSILFHMLFNLWGTFASDSLTYAGDSVFAHIGIFAGACCAAALGVFLYQKGAGKRSLHGTS